MGYHMAGHMAKSHSQCLVWNRTGSKAWCVKGGTWIRAFPTLRMSRKHSEDGWESGDHQCEFVKGRLRAKKTLFCSWQPTKWQFDILAPIWHVSTTYQYVSYFFHRQRQEISGPAGGPAALQGVWLERRGKVTGLGIEDWGTRRAAHEVRHTLGLQVRGWLVVYLLTPHRLYTSLHWFQLPQ